MATKIQEYATQYIKLARMRGLTPRNPIGFEFRPYINNQNDVYQMVVSYTEPSFADKPYNLIWIDGNPASPNFQKVLLRTSHTSDGIYRGTWEEIVDYADLYKSSQFFRPIVENAYDLGIDPGQLTTPLAGTTRIGKVILKEDQSSSIVVGSNDPRMSNARTPTSHDHADYPRTKIRINSKDFVQVDSSIAPVAGSVLALVGRDPVDIHKYLGEWRKPSLDNVDWTSPRLLNVRVSLPGNASYMSDNTDIKLVATAEWENNVVQDPDGVIWTIEENAIGVTIDPDGTVHAPDLGADVVLKVTAQLKDPVFGKTITGTYDLHIRNVFVPEDEIESLSIAGKDSLFFRERDTYIVYALFKKGGLVAVNPDNFVADKGALVLTGLFGEGARIDKDTAVTLTATYEYNGNLYTATKKVTVKAQRMTELQINGATQINSGKSASYTFFVLWTNGDKEQVTPDFFNAVPSTYTTISGNTVTAKKETESNRSTELQAGYTSPVNNQFIDARKTITIIQEAAEEFMEDFVIQGADTIIEGRSSTYRFLAIMNTGSNRTVDPDSFTSSNVGVAYIVNKTVNTNLVTKDTKITLSATFTYKGYTRSATKEITVINAEPAVALSSIKILGDTDVQQSSQHDYTVLATYSDGRTLTVQPDEFKMTTNTSYAGFDGSTGRLTIGAIDIPSVNIVLSATYTENGITKNATKSIVAKGNPATKVRIEIVGPSTVDEEKTGQFSAHYLMSDNTTQPVENLSWMILQGGEFATIDSKSGLLTAKTVTQDQTVLIRAGDGELNNQASVVIRNKADVLPESLTINGATDFVGGVDAPYVAAALFADGTTKDVSQSAEWSVSVVSGQVTATISKGMVTATVVSAPAVIKLTAIYRLEEKVVTATRNVNVLPEDVPTAYGPRYGLHTRVMSMDGFDKDFFESLKTNLTETGTQILNIPARSSTEANGLFYYAAWPARLGYGYFRDPVSGFAGSWDGAMEFDDFNFVGGIGVTIDDVLYYIYRADFPFGDQFSFSYELTYGSKDPLSGMP